MTDETQRQISAFFEAIAPWRAAYSQARLHYSAVRRGDRLLLASARIYLSSFPFRQPPKRSFKAGWVAAGQWDIPQEKRPVEEVLACLVSPGGLDLEGHGWLSLGLNSNMEIEIGRPVLLHPDGLKDNRRIGILTIKGGRLTDLLPQLETDWMLKGAEIPFDSTAELTAEYGTGPLRSDQAILEVVAPPPLEILRESRINETMARVGLFMSKHLSREQARLAFRAFDKSGVILRHSVAGPDLVWEDRDSNTVGTTSIEIPKGSMIQAVASYAGVAHESWWVSDPAFFPNPRAAVLDSLDPAGGLVRAYLSPELPPRGPAADDFETAVSWVLWALGFAPVSFGINQKTRDVSRAAGKCTGRAVEKWTTSEGW